jgi:hypothetical protein
MGDGSLSGKTNVDTGKEISGEWRFIPRITIHVIQMAIPAKQAAAGGVNLNMCKS